MLTKVKPIIVLIYSLVVIGCTNTYEQVGNKERVNPLNIEGSWQLIRETLTVDNNKYVTFDGKNRQMIKIFNNSHFSFASIGKQRPRFDSYQLTDPQKITAYDNFSGSMGSYTLNNDILIEKIEFSSFPNYEGIAIPFNIKIDGDTLIQQGSYPLILLGLGKEDGYLHATFKRIK
jgi:hypothetical protein